MDMKKIKIILILCIVMLFVSSMVSVMAVSAYLYNSNEVSYNNNASGITSNNVQGAIDELYEHATDYTSMNTRVSALEEKWPDTYSGRYLVVSNSSDSARGIIIKDNTDTIRSQLYYYPGSTNTVLASYDSSENWGQGKLQIAGKPITLEATNGGAGDINLKGNVKINGNALEDLFTINGFTALPTSSIACYNSTCTVQKNILSYKIVGNILIISGKVGVTISSRTGANPGVTITIPNSRKLKSAISGNVGYASYSDAPRNGESAGLSGSGGYTYFHINASETYANVAANKQLVLFVPPTYIALSD